MGTLVIPDTMKTLIAIGGITIPIIVTTPRIIPNHTGSFTKLIATGKKIGSCQNEEGQVVYDRSAYRIYAYDDQHNSKGTDVEVIKPLSDNKWGASHRKKVTHDRSSRKIKHHTAIRRLSTTAFTNRLKSMSFVISKYQEYAECAYAPASVGVKNPIKRPPTTRMNIIPTETGGTEANRALQVDFSPLGAKLGLIRVQPMTVMTKETLSSVRV